jgi:Arc/MetJ-type ribon-helix-helix transcriptional regulator
MVFKLCVNFTYGRKMPKKVRWCIPVTEALDRAVEEAVARDFHVCKSDLVREAVRDKLERMGFGPKIEDLEEMKDDS